MMKQIFQIMPGGKTFSILNNGAGTCAVSYQGGFVMMGGCCSVHGKVDRWGINNKTIGDGGITIDWGICD